MHLRYEMLATAKVLNILCGHSLQTNVVAQKVGVCGKCIKLLELPRIKTAKKYKMCAK